VEQPILQIGLRPDLNGSPDRQRDQARREDAREGLQLIRVEDGVHATTLERISCNAIIEANRLWCLRSHAGQPADRPRSVKAGPCGASARGGPQARP